MRSSVTEEGQLLSTQYLIVSGPRIMGEFFKPWRRKIGMLALVLACAFMVAWIRSTITYDSIEWNGNPYRFYMESCLNRLHLNCTSHLENEPRFSLWNMKPKQVWGYKKDKETGTESYDPIRFNHDRCDWRCEIAGLHVIRGRSAFNDVGRADLEFVLCTGQSSVKPQKYQREVAQTRIRPSHRPFVCLECFLLSKCPVVKL
jgi:hypothetical protein